MRRTFTALVALAGLVASALAADRAGTVPLRSQPLPDSVRDIFVGLAANIPGLLLEDKGSALAVHFRQAPQYERAAMEVMGGLAHQLREKFVLRDGKCVMELTPRGYSKRGIEGSWVLTPARFSDRSAISTPFNR